MVLIANKVPTLDQHGHSAQIATNCQANRKLGCATG